MVQNPVCGHLCVDVNVRHDSRVFCVHGGISPHFKTINDIEAINRRVEPEDGSLLADLLWSDPSDDTVPESPPVALASETTKWTSGSPMRKLANVRICRNAIFFLL